MSNRASFDAQLHQIKAPQSAVAASFAGGGGSDDDFNDLKNWAQTAPLDDKNWPDFKRLYKALEARLWPPQNRLRYEVRESELPATPVPNERDLALLGVLMGRLDAINATRGQSAPPAPQPTIAQRALNAVNHLVGRPNVATSSGPSQDTLAYMKRRAARLLCFLRDNTELSAARRDALAPLVSGLLLRPSCADVDATLPVRLRLVETDVLAAHPAAIARVWSDSTVALPILRWSFDWLQSRGHVVAVAPAQLRRFVEAGDAQWTIQLAPAALQSDESWPRGFTRQQFSNVLQGKVGNHKSAFLARRDEIIGVFARFPQLAVDQSWLRESLSRVSDAATLDWLAPWLHRWANEGEFALIEKMSEALQARFNAAIIETHPNGFSLDQWRALNGSHLPLLSPALRALPVGGEVADWIWSLPPSQRQPILSALADNPALLPLIEEHARRLDWAFIAPLAPTQWAHFARAVATSHSEGVSADDWAQIAALPFEIGFELLPLGAGFWDFVWSLPNDERAQWIERVDATRAARDFAAQNVAAFETLLASNAAGLEALGDAWLDANLNSVALDGELIVQLAQSDLSNWQTRALERLRSAPLRLPVALRLMESELPLLERVAAPFFRDENAQWSERVLALADSPKMPARELALELLREFPNRWTPDLLRQLAQHDDASVQAFVAAQLQNAPAQIVESRAVAAFDGAILNGRGRARRAKESVKTRVADDGAFDRQTLLEAARNGAPRDREWALQQLVLASLQSGEVEGLNVEGAFARAD